jgi:hypothetical protein
MRILITFLFAFGMITPTFAGIFNERDQENDWFQNCEEEIARPFCGTLKINPAVEALGWQWPKQPDFGQRVLESLGERLPTTSYLVPQDSTETPVSD